MERNSSRTFRSSLGNIITVGETDSFSNRSEESKSTTGKKMLYASINEALEADKISNQKRKSALPVEANADPAGYIVRRYSSIAVNGTQKPSTHITPTCPPGFTADDKDTQNCMWGKLRSTSSLEFTVSPLVNSDANREAGRNIWKNDCDQKPESVNSWLDESWLKS